MASGSARPSPFGESTAGATVRLPSVRSTTTPTDFVTDSGPSSAETSIRYSRPRPTVPLEVFPSQLRLRGPAGRRELASSVLTAVPFDGAHDPHPEHGAPREAERDRADLGRCRRRSASARAARP